MKFISLNTITDCRPTNNYLCSTNVRQNFECITDENKQNVYSTYMQVSAYGKRKITTHKNASDMIKLSRIVVAKVIQIFVVFELTLLNKTQVLLDIFKYTYVPFQQIRHVPFATYQRHNYDHLRSSSLSFTQKIRSNFQNLQV